MLQPLLTELVGETRRIANTILLLMVAIYVSGFLVVNIYLRQFGIAKTEIIQSQFVLAGMLYIFTASIAGLFGLLASILIVGLVEGAVWVWNHSHFKKHLQKVKQTNTTTEAEQTNATTTELERFIGDNLDKLLQEKSASEIKNLRILVPGVLVISALCCFAFVFDGGVFLSQKLMFSLLTWADEGLKNIHNLEELLKTLAEHQGLGFLAVCVLWSCAKRLHRPFLLFSTVITVFLFLVSQAYSIVWFSNHLYGNLPRSIGGGEPMLVQFVVEPDKVEMLETFGLDIEAQPATKELKTIPVRLVDTVLVEGKPILFSVLPCRPPEKCLAVELDKDIVQGLVHYEANQN